MNAISTSKEFKQKLLDRFIKYVKIWTESDEVQADKGVFPSTKRQFDLAYVLEKELKDFGMQEVQVNSDCYVYGYLPASKGKEACPCQLFLAHMDTVDEVSGKDVNPQLITDSLLYTKDKTDTIITTDKTTLLGADDKAGVAAIMTALEYICTEKTEHGPVEVMFSPDEETGHGMDKVPFNLIKSKWAFTVDGGDEGELESECFNAWSAEIIFTGKACHTGDAKAGKMVNACTMAAEFCSRLPRDKAPETTEGKEGFIALMKNSGTIESTTVNLLLRSFTIDGINEEKRLIEKIAGEIRDDFSSFNQAAKVEVFFNQQYLNMKDKLDMNPQVIQRLRKAYKAAGVKIINKPIRGGTDGSRLTEMGLPTPNIFTGAHEFHSRNEWCSLNQMSKASDILVNLIYGED